MNINKATVLGSGVMGSAIAAHLANAGIPTLLLDLKTDIVKNAIQNVLLKQKPSPIFHTSVLKLITPGNFDDHLAKIRECDWVIEAVVERLDIKQGLFAKLEKHITDGTVVSSNTSGIRLADLIAGRSDLFCKNFLITHFFNPVRYMKLVEIVASARTNPKIVSFMADFLENTLGKGVVYAKDTPSFVANRIGIYGFMNLIHHALRMNLSVEAVDKITGPATGKPKSATFRTADIAGLDTILHVAKNNYEQTKDEGRDGLKPPAILETMLKNKWLGEKSGQGFYKKIKDESGQSTILSLDLKTAAYKPQQKVRYDSLGVAKNLDDVHERIKTVLTANDEAGKFAWLATRDILCYAAERVPEIADDIVNVDNAMKWGFNWELGPFEILDVLGVKEFTEKLKQDKVKVPPLVEEVLKHGEGSFYKKEVGKDLYFDQTQKSYRPVPTKPAHIVLKTLKDEKRVLKSNAGATLIDLGDGVMNVEFHTKMNAIDADIARIIGDALDLIETDSNWRGLVISNDAPNFSVGANLMLLWMEAQQKNLKGIEAMVEQFQNMVMRLRYSKKPTVAAPSGMALGGGCEVIMACDAVRAHCETYIGLVEAGAGLIPGGCGNKNLLLNIEANLKQNGPDGWAGKSDGGPFPKVQKAFELIGFAKVAASALEGVKLGYLPGQGRTRITMNRAKLLFDAKNDVLELAKNYTPLTPRTDILVPGVGGKMAIYAAIRDYQLQGLISDHDALIGQKLAHVLCGGDMPTQGYVSEQELLDIEREAFLSLCGEEKTQARMQALLMTGKPLRN